MDLEAGGTLTIAGDVTNSNMLATDFFGVGGGNTLAINGTLTNNGGVELLGPGDMATIGNLINNAGAVVDVDGGGSTLTITGDVTNSARGTGLRHLHQP